MISDQFKRMRQEALMQRILIFASVAGVVLLIVIVNVFSYLGSGPATENRASPARAAEAPRATSAPAATGLENPTATVASEAADSAGASISPDPPRENAAPADAPRSGLVAGVAVRAGHGTPLRSLPLRIVDRAGEEVAATQTGADGAFAFRGLAPGRYYLETARQHLTYRRQPLVVADSAVTGLRFEIRPDDPSVTLPRYLEFAHRSEVPRLDAEVFRFGRVNYSLYKLDLGGSFVNIASIDDLLETDLRGEVPLESFTRHYSYAVPFSVADDRLDFDLASPGLYLLEARVGTRAFRGLLSLSSIGISTAQAGPTLTLAVRGRSDGAAQPGVLVKAVQDGRLLCEASTDSNGVLNIDFQRPGTVELLVSDGNSFAFATVEYRPRIASR